MAGLALAAPGIAEAKAGCDLVEVLLSKGDARLRGVGLVVNAKGLVDMTLDGKPSALRDAHSCNLDSPQDGFGIDCTWDYGPGKDETAEADLVRLTGRINACLPTPLEPVAPVVYTEARIKEMGAEYGPSFEEYLRTNKDLGRFKGDYPLDEDGDVSLTIDLSFNRDDRDGSLRISADFGRY